MSAAEARLYRLGGAGPDLVFVHGFGADRFGWAANAPQFFGDASVWAVDLPGHGEAPDAVGDGSAATLAHAVVLRLAQLSGPAILVGHSLGGSVALEVARIAPQLVRHLVLLAPAGMGDGIDRGFLSAFPELADPAKAQELLERLVERKRLIAPAMVQHVLTSLARQTRRAALRQVAQALSEARPSTLPTGVSVQMVWGAADQINPAPSTLPPGSLHLAGVGHMPHIEAAAKVNALIRAALLAKREA